MIYERKWGIRLGNTGSEREELGLLGMKGTVNVLGVARISPFFPSFQGIKIGAEPRGFGTLPISFPRSSREG
jgi:hypothetical protein